MINCTSNGKGMIIVLIVGLIKKTLDKISKWNFINESFKCNLLNVIFFKCNLLDNTLKFYKWNFLNYIF